MWRKWIEESLDEADLAADLMTVLLAEGEKYLGLLRKLEMNKPVADIKAADLLALADESGIGVVLVKEFGSEVDQTLSILATKPKGIRNIFVRMAIKFVRGKVRDYRFKLLDLIK